MKLTWRRWVSEEAQTEGIRFAAEGVLPGFGPCFCDVVRTKDEADSGLSWVETWAKHATAEQKAHPIAAPIGAVLQRFDKSDDEAVHN